MEAVPSGKTKLVERTPSKVVMNPEEILAMTKASAVHDSAASMHASKPGAVTSSNTARSAKEQKKGSSRASIVLGAVASSKTKRSSKELKKESSSRQRSKPAVADATSATADSSVFDDLVSPDGFSYASTGASQKGAEAKERQDSRRASSVRRVRKQAPGAISVERVGTPDISSEFSFDDDEIIPEEHTVDESLHAQVEPANNESIGVRQEDGTVTATAIARDDLEQEVRNRLFAEAVEAKVMATEESKRKISRKWLIMGCILFLLVIAGAIVAAVVATSGGDDDGSPVSLEKGGQDDTYSSNPPTAAPTELVLSNAQQEVLDSFVLEYPEDAGALSDRSSPQFKAFLWILQAEPEDLNNSPSRQEHDFWSRYAMATLYYSTGGEFWKESENWLTTLHVCEWYPNSETQCDENQTVVELKLPGNNLSGALPVELVFLSNLEMLDLSNNKIEGRLPNPWGDKRDAFRNTLKELKLSKNSLTGSLPPVYSKMEKLEVLELGQNQLSGEIASEIGLLAKLRVLDLGGRATNMTGNVPEEIWRLPNLRHINLNDLGLRASLPTAIQEATGLEIMHLMSNFLTGSIPTSIGVLTNLRVMDVTSNLLTGSLPSEIGKLHETLEKLIVRENSIGGGPVPTEVGRLTKLVSLDFAESYFSGRIPSEIFRLSLLTVLDAKNNMLSGSIPTEIALLPDLEDLSLGQNQMTGVIPSEIGSLENLRVFSAGNGLLSGTIPPKLGSATSLQTLSLADNALRGPIPSAFALLSNLRELELQGNQLTSTLPTKFQLLSSLATFNLYDNLLTGSLPVEYATSWTVIEEINIGSNAFAGNVDSITCDNFLSSMVKLSADCEEITCPCCVDCCVDGNGCRPKNASPPPPPPPNGGPPPPPPPFPGPPQRSLRTRVAF